MGRTVCVVPTGHAGKEGLESAGGSKTGNRQAPNSPHSTSRMGCYKEYLVSLSLGLEMGGVGSMKIEIGGLVNPSNKANLTGFSSRESLEPSTYTLTMQQQYLFCCLRAGPFGPADSNGTDSMPNERLTKNDEGGHLSQDPKGKKSFICFKWRVRQGPDRVGKCKSEKQFMSNKNDAEVPQGNQRVKDPAQRFVRDQNIGNGTSTTLTGSEGKETECL